MTPIAEKAMIFRISNGKDKLEDLINTVIKSQDVSTAVLDALDKRILETQEKSYVTWASVIPYLRKFVRNVLFNAISDKHPPSGYEIVDLFKEGYGEVEMEHKLCDSLYEIFRKNDNPLRGYILDALKEKGQSKSLEMLEVIKYEIEPELKTKRIVAKSIHENGMTGDDTAGVDKVIYMLEFQSLFEFSQRVNSAIDLMILRGVKRTDESKQSGSMDSIQVDVTDDSSGTIHSTGAIHKRLSRVEHYLSKANSFLPAHPPESLNNMRKAAEAICKDILDETFEKSTEVKTRKPAAAFTSLEDMVQELKRRKQIPINIEKHLAPLQSFGNFGSHDQEIDPNDITNEMAVPILMHLIEVANWYRTFDPSTGQ